MSGKLGVLSEEQRESFRALLKEHGDKIYSFAMALTRDEMEASELTAEAFSRALRNFRSYDASRPFESWVYKIAQNVHFDHKRRRKTRPTVSMDEAKYPEEELAPLRERLGDDSGLPDRELSNLEEKEMVRRALARVPEQFREPLVLCDLMAMRYEKIAEILKLPIGTVRSRIFRGRQIFKKVIGPYSREGGELWTAKTP